MERPSPRTPKVVTGTGEDLAAAMAWLEAVLAPLPPRVRERHLRRASAMTVLLAYRQACLDAPEC
jgi:hypothetical protein